MQIIQRNLPKGAKCPECGCGVFLVYGEVPDPPMINAEPDWKCAECFLDKLFQEILEGRKTIYIKEEL